MRTNQELAYYTSQNYPLLEQFLCLSFKSTCKLLIANKCKITLSVISSVLYHRVLYKSSQKGDYKSISDPKYVDEVFALISREMLELFIKKHDDYGKSNILDTGELGIAFRVSDKMNRLKHLLSTGKIPENESIV